MENQSMENAQIALFVDFENVAIWAEEQFMDLDLGRLMEYLQSRGPVVVKRAYGDWGRFAKYRNAVLENSMDLIQMYSVRAGKNRADIRLALDAFETALTRPRIRTIAIVSGDSDFSALTSRLREHGCYILGIGPRDRSHTLLVKSCDEFVYLETLFGQDAEARATDALEQEKARKLLMAALSHYERQGRLPAIAAQLKNTLLSMDPTFNETALGFEQFRHWIEHNHDLVHIYFKDLQMYVAPVNYKVPEGYSTILDTKPKRVEPSRPSPPPTTGNAYVDIFRRVLSVGMQVRHDVLRDVYSELDEQPGRWTVATLTDNLQEHYRSKGVVRSGSLLSRLIRLGFAQQAYTHVGDATDDTPLTLHPQVDSQAAFIRRIDSAYVYAVVAADVEVEPYEMAMLLVNDETQIAYVEELLNDLLARERIARVNGQYRLVGRGQNPLLDEPHLQLLIRDVKAAHLPNDLAPSVETADSLARSAMTKRSQDFVGAAQDFLLACRYLWDAYERHDPQSSLDELRWCLASYASVKAGELGTVRKDYVAAGPYYLAFFALVQEETALWDRMRGLINPMLSFYWKNQARELGATVPSTTSPAALALEMATHPDPVLSTKWRESTEQLAAINPVLVRRVAEQIRLLDNDSPQHRQVAEQIERMVTP